MHHGFLIVVLIVILVVLIFILLYSRVVISESLRELHEKASEILDTVRKPGHLEEYPPDNSRQGDADHCDNDG